MGSSRKVLKSKPAVEKLKKAGFQFRTKAAKVDVAIMLAKRIKVAMQVMMAATKTTI